MGTPAVTTRGFGVDEMFQLTNWIGDILDDISNDETIVRVRGEVLELCKKFPVYRKPGM
jgi:glycine hydroxymethyltransferase